MTPVSCLSAGWRDGSLRQVRKNSTAGGRISVALSCRTPIIPCHMSQFVLARQNKVLDRIRAALDNPRARIRIRGYDATPWVTRTPGDAPWPNGWARCRVADLPPGFTDDSGGFREKPYHGEVRFRRGTLPPGVAPRLQKRLNTRVWWAFKRPLMLVIVTSGPAAADAVCVWTVFSTQNVARPLDGAALREAARLLEDPAANSHLTLLRGRCR